jgi:hypothetical protein
LVIALAIVLATLACASERVVGGRNVVKIIVSAKSVDTAIGSRRGGGSGEVDKGEGSIDGGYQRE